MLGDSKGGEDRRSGKVNEGRGWVCSGQNGKGQVKGGHVQESQPYQMG